MQPPRLLDLDLPSSLHGAPTQVPDRLVTVHGSEGERIRVARIVARLNVGGPARHCLLLADGLTERGFDTTLYTGALDEGEATIEGARGDRTPGGAPIVRVPGLCVAPSPLQDARALAALVAELRRTRPHVVHTHTSKAGALGRLAAALAGVPVVVHTFHGHVLADYFSPLPSALVRLAERGLARLSERIVTLSPTLRDELAERFAITDRSRISVVPLGRDLTSFRAARRGALRRELGLTDDALLVGSVGRLVPIKRVPLLVRAFARAARQLISGGRDPHLVLAGDGPCRPLIEAAAREAGLPGRIHLLGWREDLAAIDGDLDLAALSSKNEGTPLSLIEAFAAGVPAVATRVGGVPDLFTPAPGQVGPAGVELRAEGALVTAEDEGALAAALVHLLERPALRAAAAAAARERAEAFSAERLLDDVAGLYRELLATRAAR